MRNLSSEQDYIQVPGAAITNAEREFLRYTAHQLTAGFFPNRITIVNIGIMWGATMWCLRAGSTGARLIGVDINIDRDAAHSVYKKAQLNAEFIEADSTHYEFHDPIHLLFIDGCHYEYTVAGDIKMWSPNVVKGGVMAFHDYKPSDYDFKLHPDTIGVRHAVDKWYASSDGENWDHISSTDSIIAFRRVTHNLTVPLFNQAEVKWQIPTPVPA